LIGDEGPGSLLSLLKRHGWVNGLSAGGGIDGSNYKDFTLAFELMPAGMFHLEDILAQSFAYLAMLKQQPFPAALFAERQKLVSWGFDYQEQKAPLQLASDLAINLQHYPVEDYIYGDYRMEAPPTELYQQLLSYFVADNLRLMLIAPEVQVDRQARWYHTPYSQLTLSEALLQRLRQMPASQECQLPSVNPYLVSQLHLLADEQHQAFAERFCQTPELTLWFKPDTEFQTPKGHIFVQLTLPHTIRDLSALALTKLWLELLLDDINEQFYPATTAGLHYNLYVQQHGLTLHSSGLSGNQIALINDILQQLPQRQFRPERFVELQRQLIQHWQNQSRNKPVSRMFSQLSALLQPLHPDPTKLAQLLQQTTFSDFTQFCSQMFQQLHIESLMLGNWTTADATTLAAQLQSWLAQLNSPGQPLPRQSYSTKGLGPVWLELPMPQEDAALVIYLPAQDRSPRSMAMFMLANHLLSPEYFHALRTEQQLGYLVGTGYVPMDLKPGLAFYVQSPRTSSADLYFATVIFYRKFLEELPDLDETEFNDLKQSLQAQIQERDNSLSSRAKRIWLALGQGDVQCQLAHQIEQELLQLTLAEFVDFCYTLLAPDHDAIFLATGPAPAHSHIKTLNSTSLRQQLTFMQHL
jgi:insulysin